jgi:hypothetical protein
MAYTTIDDPSKYFQIATFVGNESTNAITFDGNSDLQPDWLWNKARDHTHYHYLADTSRGLTKYLFTNVNIAEETFTNYITSSNTDGFTMGAGQGPNETNKNYVTYGWKANGGTTTSGAGNDSVSTSAHQADTTAGFSIVTWTGNGSDNATVKHGLSVKPTMILTKRRDSAGHWQSNNWVSEQDYAQKLKWNDTDAQTSSDDFVKSADSSVFTLGTDADVNANGGTYVGYCFAEVQGFQHFGQYTGNGNVEGPFIYTGFAPAFIIVKRWDSTTSWHLYDSGRQDFNDAARPTLKVNETEVEFDKAIDFCASGFKIRDTTSDANSAGGAYVYWAIAKRPFVSSEGAVGTAI